MVNLFGSRPFLDPHLGELRQSRGAWRGTLRLEIGLRVAWDEEHTLGARLRDGRLIELNGSVLEP